MGGGAFDLRPGDVHVWWCSTRPAPEETVIPRLLGILDSAERERHDRFHFDRDRLTFLCAHALLRILLSRYLGDPPDAWRFETEEHGRPRLAGGELDFNITHTDGLVACAFARGARVGVDVESAHRNAAWEELTHRVLGAEEVAEIAAFSGNRQARFFEYWTVKEALSKAWGTGVGTDFRRIEVCFEDGAPRIATVPDGHRRPDLLRLDSIDEFRLATARVCPDHRADAATCEVHPFKESWDQILPR